MHQERLLRLADFLRTQLPEELFDFAIIAGPNRKNGNTACESLQDVQEEMLEARQQLAKTPLFAVEPAAEKPAPWRAWECGAAGCAIGWMPVVFPDELEWGWGIYGALDVGIIGEPLEHSFRTAQAFLGISQTESAFLFEPCNYPRGRDTSATEVADRIEKFVRNNRQTNLF